MPVVLFIIPEELDDMFDCVSSCANTGWNKPERLTAMYMENVIMMTRLFFHILHHPKGMII